MKMRGIQPLAYRVIQAVGGVIFLCLTYYSLRYSQYMFPQMDEIPIDRKGDPVCCILAVGVVILAVFLMMRLEYKISDRNKAWIERIFLSISVLWVTGAGFWWISSLDRVPEGDQAFVYGGASYFLEGGYFFLEKGSYCYIYPHQLGLIALVEVLFLIVGTYNYFAFDVVSVLLAGGIVLLGYGLLKEMNTSVSARIFYCLFIMGCVPLICYTSWVYGDLPSIFFAMLAAWLVLRWQNCLRKGYLAGMVAASVMAVLVRKNSMILLIALIVLTLVYVIDSRKWQIVIAAALAVAMSFLAYQGIYKMYEIRSGYEHSDGLPVNSWIAMGMMEKGDCCGWYDSGVKDIMYATDCSCDETKEIMAGIIEERFHTFTDDPKYAVLFFRKKILSQWNEPLYQSIYFSAKNLRNDLLEPGSFLEGIYNRPEVHDKVFWFADLMQALVYFGMLLYYLFAVRKDTQPFAYLLAVTIIGGFFFSILWEAKTRYIFPYYVMMYPLAVVGYFRAVEQIRKWTGV